MSKKGKSREQKTQFYRRNFHNFPSQQTTESDEPILSPEENTWIDRIVARSRLREIDAAQTS